MIEPFPSNVIEPKSIGDLAKLHASFVTLTAYEPIGVTGADSQAQQAVIAALCKEATAVGCHASDASVG